MYYLVNSKEKPVLMGWSENPSMVHLYASNYLQNQAIHQSKPVVHECDHNDTLLTYLRTLSGNWEAFDDVLLNDHQIMLLHDYTKKPIGIATMVGYRSLKKVTIEHRIKPEIHKCYTRYLILSRVITACTKFDKSLVTSLLMLLQVVYMATKDESIDYVKYTLLRDAGSQYVGKL